jgi:hypothetical protein
MAAEDYRGWDTPAGSDLSEITTLTGSLVNLETLVAGERNADAVGNSYLVNHPECNYTIVDLTDDSTVITSSPAFLIGLYVDEQLSAHTCVVADGSTNLITIAASTDVGAYDIGSNGAHVRCNGGITIDPDDSMSAGELIVYWRPI